MKYIDNTIMSISDTENIGLISGTKLLTYYFI